MNVNVLKEKLHVKNRIVHEENLRYTGDFLSAFPEKQEDKKRVKSQKEKMFLLYLWNEIELE